MHLWNLPPLLAIALVWSASVLGAPFPKNVFDPSGAGVQPYGDWRGRAYSLSLTATF